MSRRDDYRAGASHPGGVNLSRRRLAELCPGKGHHWPWLLRFVTGRCWSEALLDRHLHVGDSRAAIVASLDPFLVAAYTDELDCVALLHFPNYLIQDHSLKLGSRLLTVNVYFPGRRTAPDLRPGPGQLGGFENFYPFIADFLSDDIDKIELRKRKIDDSEWNRCQSMAAVYLMNHGLKYRDGSPHRSWKPARD